MTEKIWYIARKGQQHGPLSQQEMVLFVKDGHLHTEDLIWRQGMSDWVKAAEFEDLSRKFAEAEAEAQAEAPQADPSDGAETAASEPEAAADDAPSDADAEFEVGDAGDAPAADADFEPDAAARSSGDGAGTEAASNRDTEPRGQAETGVAASETAGPEKAKGSVGRIVALALAALLVLAGAAYWFLSSSGDTGKTQDRIAGNEGAPTVPASRGKPTLRREGTELIVQGGILPGIADAVKAELDKAPEIKVLRLDSAGGQVEPARNLGNLIVARKLSTFTVKGCSGACTLPFIAGVPRLLYKDARLAFHRLDYSRFPEQDRAKQEGLDRQFLVVRGLASSFIDKAFAATPEAPWTPTLEELVEASAIDGIANDPGLGANIDDTKKFEAFMRALDQTAFMRAIKQHSPGFHRQVLNPTRVNLAIGLGHSPRVYSSYFASTVKAGMLKRARSAPDQAVSDLAALMAKRLKRLAQSDPQKCYQYYFSEEFGDIEYSKVLSREEILEEIDVWIAMLEAVSANPKEPPQQQEIAEQLQVVLETLSKEQGEDATLLAKRPAYPSTKMRNYCNVLANLYEIILRSPLEERGKLLRFIFAGAS